MTRGRRFVLLSSSCLLASGCLIIPCSYPKLSYLPSLDQGPELADCHAFRVDCLVHQTDNHGEYGEYTLTEVSPAQDGRISSHARMSLEKKNLFVGLIEGYHEVGLIHRTQLRLYRPGYALVELGSWDSAAKVRWRPTTNWADQEKAIDGLLNGPPATGYAGDRPLDAQGRAFRQLPKLVGDSEAEVRPLLFAATEYERVARLAATPSDVARLKRKAEELRGVTSPPRKKETP